MTRISGWVLVATLCTCPSLVPALQAQPAGVDVDFDRSIAPLVAEHCLGCHAGAKPKGGLDLSRKKTAFAGGKSGPAIIAGKPGESLLWKRVHEEEMPPKKPLPPADRELLRRWIATGAKWGAEQVDPLQFTTASRAGYDWWSLQPVQRAVPPQVSDLSWPRNPIDRFVLARLEMSKLTPSAEAALRTLIRRLYFDLLGLPPTPDEVASFTADNRPDAYERLVDQLLASPHYAERWARHWLDVVRYGETDGFERNGPRPGAYHYRNWVIQALAADTPYDEFIRLQIAGDVLRPHDRDAARATGFLVAGVHNTVLGNDQMRAIARQDELEDMVGSVGQTVLGMTVNCGRCHDHKFDPISQADYYRFASALGGVEHGERELPDPGLQQAVARVQAQLEDAERQRRALEEPARLAVRSIRQGDSATRALVPQPFAAWDFKTGLKDQVGKLDAQPLAGARTTPAGIAFDGKGSFGRTPLIGKEIREKTLEAWVRLDHISQRGGGVISLQTPDGVVFDAIVFGEQEPGKWMAGSDVFRRYRSFGGPVEEDAGSQVVQFAITYAADGTISGYRNGRPYGTAYRSAGVVTYQADRAVILFGCRHEPAGGNRMLAGVIEKARLYDRALSPREVLASFEVNGAFVSDQELMEQMTPADRTRLLSLRERTTALAAELANLRTRKATRAYVTISRQPPATRLLVRGQLTEPGEVIAPGGLSALRATWSDFGLPPDSPEGERRRRLAEWLTAAENPLFARVMVNRVWHYHFGTGLVETPNDFGFNAGRPSHPELLDWLASEFASSGYRLKALHRLIVTSATYRQSSAPRAECVAVDAETRLLWRKRPMRLDAEVLRDGLLANAGLLNRALEGQGFSDYRVIDAKNGTTYYVPYDPVGPEHHRRSIYRFIPRGADRGLLDAFDCPDPAAAAPRRTVTTTPLQALSLWNGAFALRMAESLAARVQREAGPGIGSQVELAYRLAYQRDPVAAEREAAIVLVEQHGLRALARVLFNASEYLAID